MHLNWNKCKNESTSIKRKNSISLNLCYPLIEVWSLVTCVISNFTRIPINLTLTLAHSKCANSGGLDISGGITTTLARALYYPGMPLKCRLFISVTWVYNSFQNKILGYFICVTILSSFARSNFFPLNSEEIIVSSIWLIQVIRFSSNQDIGYAYMKSLILVIGE